MYLCRVYSDQKDNIYAVNGSNQINIYRVENEYPVRQITTNRRKALQICATRSGDVITGSCNVKPSTVTVYDKEGKEKSVLRADHDDEFLYPTVDAQDRILVARVRSNSDVVRISIYTMSNAPV